MTWQIDLILFYLGTALLFYVLFAGADFGAGILELFLGRTHRNEQRHLITRAMAPVWEANHVWIVLVVVILFMAFPPLYAAISIHLFLPVLALLVGVVFRGCAFTFRHYDTDKTYYRAYSWAFSLSSLWSAFFLGLTGGAFLYGNILPNAPDFSTLYLAPWWNPFCVALGLFTACLFVFLAAVFLVGEASDPDLRQLFRRKAAVANLVLVVAGAAVFWFGEREPLALRSHFFATPLSVACFVAAGALWIPFWVALRRAGTASRFWVRATGVAIVALVLFGWYAVQYPVALRYADGSHITFLQAAAPTATLNALLGGLVGGTFLIFPALGYLFKVFKWETLEKP